MQLDKTTTELFGKTLEGVVGEGFRAFDVGSIRTERDRSMQTRSETDAYVLTNPVITNLVRGQMTQRQDWTRFFGTPINVPNIKFDMPSWLDNNWMERKDTLRPERVPYAHGFTEPSEETETLQRHSFATMLDVRTIRNANSYLTLASRASGFAARIVDINRQFAVRDLLTTVGNYAAGHVDVLGAGSEWDHPTGGDPVGDVQAGIRKLCNALGVSPDEIEIALTYESVHALQISTDWKARVGISTGPVAPDAPTRATENAIAQFFGVGAAHIMNPWGKERVSAADVTGPLFSDDVFLYVSNTNVGNDFDQLFGSRWFFSEYQMNAGISSAPFYENKETSWMYPWDREYRLRIDDAEAGYIIRNTSSLV